MIDLVTIGRVLKSHGVQGELLVQVANMYHRSLESCRALFLDIDGNKVPFMLESWQPVDENYIVKLKHIDDRSESVRMHGSAVMINRSELVDVGEAPVLPDLSGFVIEHDQGAALIIQRLEELPQQTMMVCKAEDDLEVMIPLVEQWIVNIDEDRQVIHMELPEGLV